MRSRSAVQAWGRGDEEKEKKRKRKGGQKIREKEKKRGKKNKGLRGKETNLEIDLPAG